MSEAVLAKTRAQTEAKESETTSCEWRQTTTTVLSFQFLDNPF